MPLELRPGVTVPVPCRACGEGFIPFKIEAGRHRLRCPRCGETTVATVSLDAEESWRVRTEARSAKAPVAGRR